MIECECRDFLRDENYSGTPLYGHLLYTDSFVCPDKKAHIFSPKLTRFIRTPVNTDTNKRSQTLIYCQPRFTDTGYPHTVCFHSVAIM